MNDKNSVLFIGIAFVVLSVVGLYLFLKFIKKDKYESPVLGLSNLKVILSLISIGVFGLFLIFYKMF